MSFFVLAAIAVAILVVMSVRRKRPVEEPHGPVEQVTADDFTALADKYDADSLPLLQLEPVSGNPGPLATRLGGGPWTADNSALWPTDTHGRPLVFVAQLNFSELGDIDDFPSSGLLQIFVRHDGTGYPAWGEFSDDCQLVWHEDPAGGTTLAVPESLIRANNSMFASEQARFRGIAVKPVHDTLPANPFNWPHGYEYLDRKVLDRPPADENARALQIGWELHLDAMSNAFGTHWIGGHPRFVQDDVRSETPKLQHLNRVLLHLGWDDHVHLGDGGEMNIMISREDLIARRFENAYYTWDCS